MDLAKMRFGRWYSLAAKCLLSGAALFVLLWSLDLMRVWYAMHPAARRAEVQEQTGMKTSQRSEDDDWKREVGWPQFFGSDNSPIQEMSFNGVEVLNQVWETSVAPVDVIEYYRQQMTARGWQDVTEEAQMQSSGSSASSQQVRSFLMVHGSIVAADLTLRRNGSSIQIGAIPSDKRDGYTRVSICAAATPSLENFVTELSSAFGANEKQGGEPLDIMQQNNGKRYHVTIATRSASAEQAFQDELSTLGDQGWRQAMIMPPHQKRTVFFAWLTRGSQYAAVSVSPAPQGGGSTVTLNEVTSN